MNALLETSGQVVSAERERLRVLASGADAQLGEAIEALFMGRLTAARSVAIPGREGLAPAIPGKWVAGASAEASRTSGSGRIFAPPGEEAEKERSDS